ncbi:fumarylacetoacetate hydrolase family protein [Amycolatopsis pithecellobii]|uniref:Fumarylacetoacetate hydrolase n=1 Tax=Amycolatopsis pithecellobii TaxID=664692 RepID=A0A6N7Z1V7_9PSEU|nr:fumarylacetoacetate hydrolase family protein [Amycolatopsis pithecellobii]MTD52516.1 fumarylacetoacetate hydrolase [Amycolatopsis pithecellobii]
MRLAGMRFEGDVVVAAVRSEGLRPLARVTDFWADPHGLVTDEFVASRPVVPRHGVEFVPPVRPDARILCVGLNYADHVAEGPFSVPDHPTIFGRWTPSLAVTDQHVAVPVDENGLDWEAELLAVVGSRLSVATVDEAKAGVFAYACFNDITARRAQKLTTQWTIGKNVDGSGAMSELVTVDEAPDPATGLRITARVNGEVTQDASTDQMIFRVSDLLAFLSRSFELRPGDLVATGTPSGVGYARTPAWLLQAGDSVEVAIEGIGSVRSHIVATSASSAGAAVAGVPAGR